MFISVIILYLIIIIYETRILLKEKNTKTIWIYIPLTTMSMVISLLIIFGIPLISPSNLIKNIIINIFGKYE